MASYFQVPSLASLVGGIKEHLRDKPLERLKYTLNESCPQKLSTILSHIFTPERRAFLTASDQLTKQFATCPPPAPRRAPVELPSRRISDVGDTNTSPPTTARDALPNVRPTRPFSKCAANFPANTESIPAQSKPTENPQTRAPTSCPSNNPPSSRTVLARALLPKPPSEIVLIGRVTWYPKMEVPTIAPTATPCPASATAIPAHRLQRN